MMPPPSSDQRQMEIEAVAQHVLDRLNREKQDRDALKEEILEEIRKEAAKKKPSFFQHPAVLLVIGFLLTGGVGTWLTSYWQSKEQAKQQAEQAHKRAVEQKYEVMEQLNKAVAEVYTAGHVIINLLSYDHRPQDFPKELTERDAFWKQARRNWSVASLVLEQKLSVHFKDDEAKKVYEKILEDGDSLSIALNNILPQLKDARWRRQKKNKAEMDAVRMESLELTNNMRDNTTKLLGILTAKVKAQEQAPAQPTPTASPTAQPSPGSH